MNKIISCCAIVVGMLCASRPCDAQVLLLPANHPWSWLNPGTAGGGLAADPHGPTPKDPDFNSTWMLGAPAYDGPAFNGPNPGPFHYGQTDRPTFIANATNVGQPPSGSRYTTYFRTTFTTTQAYLVSMRVVRDDGAIVYLNGQEVGRSAFSAANTALPDTFGLFSGVTVDSTAEETYFDLPVPENMRLLLPGTHVLAASIHQVNNTSSDLSFALELYGAPAVPDFGRTLVDLVEMTFNGLAIGTRSATGAGATLGFTATNGGVQSQGGQIVLPLGAQWRYYVPTSNPSDTDEDFESTWFTVDVPDSTYDGPGFTQSGPAILAYGGIDFQNPPATALATPPTPRYTSYFTTTFELAGDPADLAGLVGRILADDAAVILFNGEEVLRFATGGLGPMASGPVNYFSVTGANAGVENALTNISLPTGALRQGTNYVSVSVHQNNDASSDLGFGLELSTVSAEQAFQVNNQAATLLTERLDVRGVEATRVSVDVFAYEVSAGSDFEINDFVEGFVEGTADGFTFVRLAELIPRLTGGGGEEVTEPAVDLLKLLELEGAPRTYSALIPAFDGALRVRITMSVDSTTEFILIDNLRLTAVPEPASLGLVACGLAALALVRRRRKSAR